MRTFYKQRNWYTRFRPLFLIVLLMSMVMALAPAAMAAPVHDPGSDVYQHLGRSSNAAHAETLAAGYMIGERLTFAHAGTVSKVYVYLDGKAAARGSETLSASVYGEQTHQGGPVGLLATSSNQLKVAAGTARGWYSFNVNFRVGAQWDVWVFIKGGGNSVVNLFKDGTGGQSAWARVPSGAAKLTAKTVHRSTSAARYSLNVVEKLGDTSVLPSGVAMPIGDLGSWKQVFAEDFKTSAPAGTSAKSFKSIYANSWCGYDEGAGDKYYNDEVLSAHNGVMDFSLDGKQGAAGSFDSVDGSCGQLYGRFTLRFKATGGDGYGTAMMLWPNSEVWGDGEIDFPEGSLTNNFWVYQHGLNCDPCPALEKLNTGKFFTSWHTATTDWTPKGMTYYLDGKQIMKVTTQIPVGKHRMTVQMWHEGVPVASPGHLLIDWVAIYSHK